MSASSPGARLSDEEILRRLSDLPGWSRSGDAICLRTRTSDFRAAQALVNRICDVAEGANHHPTIHWTYSNVQIELSTHDADGITLKDFALAAVISTLVPEAIG